MPDTLHEHMNQYLEQRASLDPKCMRCGKNAAWQLQGLGIFQRMSLPEILCHRCLSGVDPVHIPVYGDPPAKIPLHRWHHEAHKPIGQGTMPWLGFQVHLAILGADDVLQTNQFIDSQLLGHLDVVRITVEGMGRQLAEELRDRPLAAPPE
jgi:hypothetical protein